VRFRDCDLTGLRIIDCIIGDGVISGDFDRLVVNDVDVSDFVRDELDRRQPERVLLRSLGTAQDHRDTWAAPWTTQGGQRGGRSWPSRTHRGAVSVDDVRQVVS